MTAPMSGAALLPCPFCGQSPETFGSGEKRRGLMIECLTEGCVNPSVSYYNHADAITAWNTRATVAAMVEAQPVAWHVRESDGDDWHLADNPTFVDRVRKEGWQVRGLLPAPPEVAR